MCRCDGYLFQVVLSWTGSVNQRVLNRIPRFTGKLISSTNKEFQKRIASLGKERDFWTLR